MVSRKKLRTREKCEAAVLIKKYKMGHKIVVTFIVEPADCLVLNNNPKLDANYRSSGYAGKIPSICNMQRLHVIHAMLTCSLGHTLLLLEYRYRLTMMPL